MVRVGEMGFYGGRFRAHMRFHNIRVIHACVHGTNATRLFAQHLIQDLEKLETAPTLTESSILNLVS